MSNKLKQLEIVSGKKNASGSSFPVVVVRLLTACRLLQ